MFLILGLPVLMYPLFIGVGTVFVAMLKDKKLTVGVVGMEYLPKPQPDITPAVGGPAGVAFKLRHYPPLIVDDKFVEKDEAPTDPDSGGVLVVKPLAAEDEA